MSAFQINFTYPWLLLLFIPAAIFTLLPYFKLKKRYRRTRNRVISVILHSLVMTLAILALSGLSFSYDIPNRENEIMLLVDVSYSNRESDEERDSFVKQVIDESSSRFRVGVVTFGYDRVYAARLSTDGDAVYEQYKKALELQMDDSGTDVAAAISYAQTLFENPSSAKIVVISDGFETDGDALTAAKRAAANGVKVSAVSCPLMTHGEMQLLSAELPDRNISLDEEFSVKLTVQSSYEGDAEITLFDNNEEKRTYPYHVYAGVQEVELGEVSVSTSDLHEFRFELESDGDELDRNNSLYTYLNLKEFKKVLMLERYWGEGEKLQTILEDADYEVDRVDIDNGGGADLPQNLTELRNTYHQVILVNISNADLTNTDKFAMPENFDETLNQFVSVCGGGVFTVGGVEGGKDYETLDEDSPPTAHAFNREDVYLSDAFKEMLPVQVVDYKPPIALMLLVDRSGSMSVDVPGGKNMLDVAKESALQCLNTLTYRDYIGVLALDGAFTQTQALTSMLNRQRVEEAIKSLTIGGDTLYRPALEFAYRELNALGDKVANKHIILISDGLPSDRLDEDFGGYPQYGELIDRNFQENGITVSVITIDSEDGLVDDLRDEVNGIASRGHGQSYIINRTQVQDIVDAVKKDISRPEITETKYGPYTPEIVAHNSVTQDVDERYLPKLNGFFGVREKDGSVTSLGAEFSPLYTQWSFGKGKVGAFMCSLSGGAWSEEFVNDNNGQTIIRNIVKGLMPTDDIREVEIRTELSDGNFVTRLSVMTQMDEGDYLEVTIDSPAQNEAAGIITQTIYPEATAGQARIDFSVALTGIKREGLHKITVKKYSALGEEIASFTTYKVLSYSREYNSFNDTADGAAFLSSLAESGRGELLDFTESGISGVFLGFDISRHIVYDPALAFMIAAIVLFLLDIAVRKFRFKWLHEIIRDRREKKRLQQGAK